MVNTKLHAQANFQCICICRCWYRYSCLTFYCTRLIAQQQILRNSENMKIARSVVGYIEQLNIEQNEQVPPAWHAIHNELQFKNWTCLCS